MIAVYLRCSTINQRTDRQVMNLEEILTNPDVTLYEDKGVSGSVDFQDRPAGSEVYKKIQSGEVTELHVYEMSRLGRSLSNILEVLDFCVSHGCQVKIHRENLLLLDDEGKTNPITKLIIGVMGSVHEMTREQILINTREGIEAARRRGAYRGRRKGTTESDARFLAKPRSRKIQELLNEEYPVSHIARVVGCSPNTIYKVKNTLERVA